MSDDDTTTTTTTDERPHERVVSYDRFKELNDKLTKERAQRSELEARMQQLEDRDKTDVERLTKELERAQKASEAASKDLEAEREARVSAERASWLQAAAAKANFHNPDVASKMVDLGAIEDSAAADKAVKGLAKDNAWLVKQDAKQPPLQKVGIAGTDDASQQSAGMITQEQQVQEWGKEIFKGLTDRAPLPGAVDDE
jgi:predicted RNase H-like nuclease (RuvC/YqgF family)